MTRYNLRERITDPRVRKRVQKALNFALALFDSEIATPWGTRGIDKYFGQQQSQPSKQLRALLLETVVNTYRFGDKSETKSYKIKPEGAEYIQHLLDGQKPTYKRPSKKKFAQSQKRAVENVFQDHATELHFGVFEYENKSDRYWHRLQHIKTAQRRENFANYGYIHVYDIHAAAPMALVCKALTCTIKPISSNDVQPILDYISNRNLLRSQLSAHTGLCADVVKRIITALFTGATLSTYEKNQMFNLVGRNANIIMLLRNHAELSALRASIKLMWQSLRAEHDLFNKYLIPRSTVISAKTQKERLKRISSSDKGDLYRKCEMEIMNTIEEYHKLYCGAKIFREHDGWCSDTKVNLCDLTDYVQQQTIYDRIQFDYELVQHSQVT
jgi:hypothetical protein